MLDAEVSHVRCRGMPW